MHSPTNRLVQWIQLVATAVIIVGAELLIHELKPKVHASVLFAILIAFVIVVAKALEFIAERAFDSSTWMRRLVLGSDFIEGVWLHRIFQGQNTNNVSSFAVITIACEHGAYTVTGKAYNLDGTVLGSFSTAATVYTDGRLRSIYDGLKSTSESLEVIGYSEYKFLKSGRRAYPLAWSGYLYDTDLKTKYLTEGVRITNRQTLDDLERDNGVTRIVESLAKPKDDTHQVVQGNITSAEVTGLAHYLKKERHQSRLRVAEEFITECFQKRAGRSDLKMLSIGCADGEFEMRYVTQGVVVYGIDGVALAIEKANAKGIRGTVADFSAELPYDTHSFDVVFAGEVIEHVFDVPRFLNEVFRVLRPDGELVLTTPNLARLTDRIRFLFGWSPKHVSPTHPYLKYHIHPFTPTSLRLALSEAGFQIVASKTNCVRLFGIWDSYLLGRLFPSIGNSLIVKAKH